jgi:antitoxin VapB
LVSIDGLPSPLYVSSYQADEEEMALNIKSKETDRLARELAALTGESITDAVGKAVAERLERCRRTSKEAMARRAAAIHATIERARKLPVLDDRSPDEIIGYNDKGHWD